MKVLIVSEYFYPIGKGGGEISGFLFAKELAKNSIDIHVLTSFFDGMKKDETIDGVKIHRLLKSGRKPNSLIDNIKRRLFFEKSLLKELEALDRKENFDIIHCMNATSIPAVKLKGRLNKRFFLHVNSPVLFCPKGTLMYKDKESCDRICDRKTFLDCYIHSRLIGKFEPNLLSKYNPFFIYIYRKRYEEYQRDLKKFDHYIAISDFMKKCLVRSEVDHRKITVIYPLIESERFLNLKRPHNKVLKILYLGEYSKPKGPQVLLEALKGVTVPYEANFYGEGVLKAFLEREAKSNNLNANIHGKADYDDVPKIMEKHDVVVVPSLVAEGFGRVAYEASVAGKCVLVNDVGGLKEAVGGKGKEKLYGDIVDLTYKLNNLEQVKNRSNKIQPNFNKNVLGVIKEYDLFLSNNNHV
jgi:glycosyltransferase involved in cell wall biosynthesis